ncbi:MAG: trigger factor [Chloroflexi bacterium]|nr:trigger factor [Chloroflexota bacterium]
MKVTKEKEENKQAFLRIEVEPDEVKQAIEKTFQRVAQRTKIEGFRQGKAPRALLEQRIDKDKLFEEALRDLVPDVFEKALKEQNIEAFAQPQLEVAQTEPVVITATVPLRPTITLGDYRSIRIPPKVVEVKDEEVNQVIENLRHQLATWEQVERPVPFSDYVIFDIESTVEDKPFINLKKAQYRVQQDVKTPVPGFAEQLVGMTKNETKEFKLPVPADYVRAEFAGKEATFKVTITEIREEKLPELNDEFAKKVNPEFSSVQALRDQVTSELKQRAEQTASQEYNDEVVAEATRLSQAEYPPILVETEIGSLFDEQVRRLQSGGINLEQYLKSTGKSEEQFREELRPLATKRVNESLVVGKIVEEEKTDAGDDEIDAEISTLTQGVSEKNRGRLLRSFNTPETRESVRRMVKRRKAVQWLTELAKGTEEKK